MGFTVPPQCPRRNGWITPLLGRWLMRISGWRFEGALPDVSRLVIAVAPHSSNWDFFIGVAALWALDIRISFMAKHTIFFWPFSVWLRSLGGIAVDRRAPHGVVGELIHAFEGKKNLILVITPEGTRAYGAKFKSGFIYIAAGAKVPILLASFDYSHRVINFGKVIQPSDDPAADLREIMDYFRPVKGRYPKQWQN